MERTQVYLGGDELDLLDREKGATGASRSELIRRAIRVTYGRIGLVEKLRALEASAGSWKGRDYSTGTEYVEQLRSGDLNARLRRLGLED